MVYIQNIQGTPTTQQQIIIMWFKNGQGTLIDVSLKKTYKCYVYEYRQMVDEEVLSITNHQGNATQNHNEIPLTCQDGYFFFLKWYQMLISKQKNWNSCILLVGM